MRVLRLVFSFVADHAPARPSTSSNSSDTAVGGWSSPTSTSSKSCCITTVSAHSRINHPSVLPNISPLASDGAGEGKSELLGISTLLYSDGGFFLLPYKSCGCAVIYFPRRPAFDLRRTRFPYPPHLVVCLSDKPDNRMDYPNFTHKSVLAHSCQSYHAHTSLPQFNPAYMSSGAVRPFPRVLGPRFGAERSRYCAWVQG